MSAGGRKPHSVSVGSRATNSSGLWLASLYVRWPAASGTPRASSAANPVRAWTRSGWAWTDSGSSAASSLTRNGSPGATSARLRPSGRCDGSSGWAPIQISAQGSAAGTGSPSSAGSTVRDPHA